MNSEFCTLCTECAADVIDMHLKIAILFDDVKDIANSGDVNATMVVRLENPFGVRASRSPSAN